MNEFGWLHRWRFKTSSYKKPVTSEEVGGKPLHILRKVVAGMPPEAERGLENAIPLCTVLKTYPCKPLPHPRPKGIPFGHKR
jgi:hypothetical protein